MYTTQSYSIMSDRLINIGIETFIPNRPLSVTFRASKNFRIALKKLPKLVEKFNRQTIATL